MLVVVSLFLVIGMVMMMRGGTVRFMFMTVGGTIAVVAMVQGIDDYRKQVYEKEGRHLNSQQAALEWISHHANDLYDKAPPSK